MEKSDIIKKNGKKGQAYKFLTWIFLEAGLTLLVLIFIAVIVHIFVQFDINVQDIERELFVENLLYSSEGISYVDSISGRVYPGVIDLEDFSNTVVMEAKLGEAFNYGGKTPGIAVSMVLKDLNIPHYYFTDSGELKPHLKQEDKWVEKEMDDISAYASDQLTTYVYNNQEVSAVYYEKDWYFRWLELVGTKIIGKGGFTEYKMSKVVLVRDSNGEYNNGVLQFSIIMPGRDNEDD